MTNLSKVMTQRRRHYSSLKDFVMMKMKTFTLSCQLQSRQLCNSNTNTTNTCCHHRQFEKYDNKDWPLAGRRKNSYTGWYNANGKWCPSYCYCIKQHISMKGLDLTAKWELLTAEVGSRTNEWCWNEATIWKICTNQPNKFLQRNLWLHAIYRNTC